MKAKGQASLFDGERPTRPTRPETRPTRPAVRRTDPWTSRAAWQSLDLPERYRRILAVLQHQADIADRRVGYTSSEMADRLKLERDSVSPRMPELEEMGLVGRSEEKRVFRGRGNPQTVWILV